MNRSPTPICLSPHQTRYRPLNAQTQAIADGTAFQIVEELIDIQTATGVSEQDAVFNLVGALDMYQKQDLRAALILMRHLRKWLDTRTAVTRIGERSNRL